MSTELIERLRRIAERPTCSCPDSVTEAADELERLQREVEVQAYWGDRWVQQHAECQRLRDAMKEAIESGEDGDWQSARRALTAAALTPNDQHNRQP